MANRTIYRTGQVRVDYDFINKEYVVKPLPNPETWEIFGDDEKDVAIDRANHLTSPKSLMQLIKKQLAFTG